MVFGESDVAKDGVAPSSFGSVFNVLNVIVV